MKGRRIGTSQTPVKTRRNEQKLILGSFIKEWALDAESWKAAAPYVDMIAPQHINESIDVNEHTIDPATAEKLKDLKVELFSEWEKHSVKPERTR